MNIAALTTADILAALRLSTQAGWNQMEIDWERLLNLWSDDCLGGWVGPSLVATSTIAAYAGGLAWIGMVLVDESFRGQGLGGAMFTSVMSRVDSRYVGLDASDAGRVLYRKHGFVDVSPIVRWTGVATRQLPAIETRVLDAHHDPLWQTAMRFDHVHFGFDRSVLLQRLANEPDTLTIGCVSGAEIHGIALVRPGRTAHQIGPVVADGPDIAEALVAAALDRLATRNHGARVILDVVDQDNGFAAILSRLSLTPSRHLTRMYRGDIPPATAQCYAAAGFELG